MQNKLTGVIMEEKSMIRDMTRGSVLKNLIAFAIPFMLSNLLQTVYSMVDMIVVGQFVGSIGLSAVTISSQIIMFMTSLTMGFTTGGQILISQQVGIHNKEGLNSTIGTLFSTVAVLGVLLSVVVIALYRPLLEILNTPAESWDQACQYTVICGAGNIFTCGYITVSAILQGMGDSKKPLMFIGIASVLNIILDLLFVAVFRWASAGAAWATIIGQAVSFITSIIYLYRRKESFGFDFKFSSFRFDKNILKILLRLGLPLGLQNSAISISMMFVSHFVNAFGLAAASTFGVGRRVEMIPEMLSQSLSMATSTIIGQNMAAGNIQRSRKAIHITLACNTVVYIVFAIIFGIFPKEIFSVFTTDIDVLNMAPLFISTVLVSFPAFAIMDAYLPFIQGIGNAKVSLIFAILDGVVSRIGLSLLFGFVLNWGLYGFFLGYALAAYSTAVPSAIYFYSGVWKKRKMLVTSNDLHIQ
jgi:putative MATE family efflux protein